MSSAPRCRPGWEEIDSITSGRFRMSVFRATNGLAYVHLYRVTVYASGVEVDTYFGDSATAVVRRALGPADAMADEACLLADGIAALAARLVSE